MHIVFIAQDDAETSRLCDDLTEWLGKNRPEVRPNLFLISVCDIALRAVARPIAIGEAPALIVADHKLDPARVPVLADRLRDLFPESWVVEMVDETSAIPRSPEALVLRKPVASNEWISFLEHIFLRAQTPQWSRAALHEIGF